MANTGCPTECFAEKELSTSPTSPTHEESKSQELSDAGLGENNQNELRILDDSGIKPTPVPSEHLPGRPPNGSGNSAELPAEPAVEQPGPPEKDYSILTVPQKRMIVITASLASLFSPMATAIYCEYPVDPILCKASS
jgi:hypothetical protein